MKQTPTNRRRQTEREHSPTKREVKREGLKGRHAKLNRQYEELRVANAALEQRFTAAVAARMAAEADKNTYLAQWHTALERITELEKIIESGQKSMDAFIAEKVGLEDKVNMADADGAPAPKGKAALAEEKLATTFVDAHMGGTAKTAIPQEDVDALFDTSVPEEGAPKLPDLSTMEEYLPGRFPPCDIHHCMTRGDGTCPKCIPAEKYTPGKPHADFRDEEMEAFEDEFDDDLDLDEIEED